MSIYKSRHEFGRANIAAMQTPLGISYKIKITQCLYWMQHSCIHNCTRSARQMLHWAMHVIWMSVTSTAYIKWTNSQTYCKLVTLNYKINTNLNECIACYEIIEQQTEIRRLKGFTVQIADGGKYLLCSFQNVWHSKWMSGSLIICWLLMAKCIS